MSRERTHAVEREALARRTSGPPASRSGGALSAQAGLLLSLQQSAGNRAVTGLVQRVRERAEHVHYNSSAPAQLGRGVVERMKQKDGRTEIRTLTALNQYLKQLNSRVWIGLDDFEDEPPTDAQLDEAVAASTKIVDRQVTKKELVSDLKDRLAAGKKPKQAKDPLQVRKELAKQVPKYSAASGGDYYGGKGNELHVHSYGSDFHVKVGADNRKNIYVNGTLKAGVLKDARDILSTHARGPDLNAAIDRALLERNLDLDKY